jgi:YVTN family beta-propeller protein
VLALRPSPSVIANIPVGKFPVSLSVNALTNVAYVANYSDNTVGGNPGAISVNPTTNMIYVAIAPSKTVAVIGGKTNSVITNITVGGYPLAVSTNN